MSAPNMCFSDFNVHISSLEVLFKCRFWFSRSEVRDYFSKKLPNNADTPGLGTTLLVVGVYCSSFSVSDLNPNENWPFNWSEFCVDGVERLKTISQLLLKITIQKTFCNSPAEFHSCETSEKHPRKTSPIPSPLCTFRKGSFSLFLELTRQCSLKS